MNKLIKAVMGLSVILLFLTIGSLFANAQTEEPSSDICRIYRANVDNVAVRACANDTCAALANLSLGESVCVRNNNQQWYEVDLDPDNPEAGEAYVLSTLLEADAAQAESEFEYCDAYRVIPEEAIIRVCPSLACQVLRTIQENEVVCAADYGTDDTNWVEVSGGLSGVAAWVDMDDLVYAREDTNCDVWRVNTASTIARTCPQIACDVAQVLNQGTEICSAGESFEEQLWLGVYDSTGRFGWIYANLLEATQLPANELYSRDSVIRATVEAQATNATNAAQNNFQQASATQTPLPSSNNGLTIVETPSVCPTTEVNSEQCVLAVENSSGIQAIDLPLNRFLTTQIEMNSPQSNASFRLRIPEDWAIQGNNILNLSFSYSESGESTGASRNPITRLDIRMDNQLLESIALSRSNIGVQSIQIPLPQALLASTSSHIVEFELTALDHCEDELVSRVLIDGEVSNVHLEYQETSPIINLSAYPRPFYEGHPTPEMTYIVLPDNPDSVSLSTAGSIVAGIGAVASGLEFEVLTVSELGDAIYRTNNLILVGKIQDNPLIADYYARALLPTNLGVDNALRLESGQLIDSEDGVIQIIQHPEDSRFAILVATGQSDAGLLKAGQALGGRPNVLGLQNNLSIVSDVQPSVNLATSLATGMRFEQLGYPDDIVLSGIGEQSIFVDFFVPFGVAIGEDAFINLIYNSSSVLEQSGATLTISVNDIPIASNILEPQADSTNTFFSARSLQAKIPATAILQGRMNYISITLNTQDLEDCQPYDNIATWLTISRESEIFLPISINEPPYPLVGYFPAPFNLIPSLSELIVVLPDNPSHSEINQAMDILFRLGASSLDASGINPQIVRGYTEGIDWSNYHLIVIGRPSTNSFFVAIADNLPQPFMTGSDELEQVFNNVVYRLNDGYDVGLIETISSPYNAEKTVLVLTGTNDFTQALAVNALADAQFSFRELLGDVVFINEGVAFPIDSHTVSQSFEILQAVPLLATESALILQSTLQPMTEIAQTQAALIPTTTPFIVATAENDTNTGNVYTVQETAILVITPTDEIVSAAATIVPLQASDLEAAEASQPEWVQYLIIVTITASVISFLYLLIPRFAKRQKN